MLGPAFDVKSLNEISIPLRIVVGDRDDQAVPKLNAMAIQAAVHNAKLQVLPDVAHYTFLANCTVKGRLFVRELCADPSGVDRREIHHRIADDAFVFFNQVFSQPDNVD
jgi:predicted dienelactone hydrolase